jgi:hypothetical protein
MTEESSTSADDFSADLEAFQQVASAFQRLDHDGRLRLLRTIATLFRLDLAVTSRNSGLSSPPATAAPILASSTSSFSEDRTPSPKDFLRDKKPRTDVDRVAVLAYYLTHYRGIPHFKTVDLSQLNTEAAQVKFSNAAQAVDNATKAGLLVTAVKGAKQLSAHGESYVQALPDREAAKVALQESRPRRRKRSGSMGSKTSSADADA